MYGASKIKSSFEDLKTTIGCSNSKDDNCSTNRSIFSNDIFGALIAQNKELNNRICEIKKELKSIKSKFREDFEKNITFNTLFLSIEQLVDEYNTQTQIFETYANDIFNDICNEENIVKTLDLLRMILNDRKTVMSNIISELIKIQKLANDRLKIELSNNQDDDISDILESDEF